MAGRQGEREVTHGECHFVDAWQGHAGRVLSCHGANTVPDELIGGVRHRSWSQCMTMISPVVHVFGGETGNSTVSREG